MSPPSGTPPAPPQVRKVPRPEWSPVPFPGTRGVDGKVLLSRPELTVAMLRFGPDATIHEHDAEHLIEVVCLEGRGFTSIDGVNARIEAGESVVWPPRHQHRLWTEGSPMLTLMIEHNGPRRL